MLRRAAQLLAIAALVNLVYQYWPRGVADELIPVINAESKFGFVDGSGRVRIDLEWDDALPFDEGGNACIKKGEYYGVIDRSGRVIVSPEYEFKISFDEHGLARAWRSNRVGLVNRQGEMVVPIECGYIEWFDEGGLAVVRRDGRKGLVDLTGRFLLQPKWDEINAFGPQGVAAIKNTEGWWLIDREGNMLVEEPMNYMSVGEFGEDGLAWVKKRLPTEDPRSSGSFGLLVEPSKTGWIDLTGREVIAPEWDDGGDFSAGLAMVVRNDQCGWINVDGEIVIPPKWNQVEPFGSRGIAGVEESGGWGAIDRKGNKVVEAQWFDPFTFDEDGYAIVRSKYDFKRGIINDAGEIVVEPKWTAISGFDEKGHAQVFGEDFQWGVVDQEGQVLFKRKGRPKGGFDANDLMAFTDPVVFGSVSMAPLIGWINRSGEVVIKPPQGSNWFPLGDGRWEGIYVMAGPMELEGSRAWMERLKSWLAGEEYSASTGVCHVYNKQGDLIWSSTWLRKTTKAWLLLISALMILLVISLLGRKRGKVVKEEP